MVLDPLTVTATLITLGTFIKDLIELGEDIHSSIKKNSENRRQIRDLTQDILRTLYALASLTRGKEGVFRGPQLLAALESLKAEMLYVHSKCLKISPIRLPGLRGIPSHLKAWRNRDGLEKQIARLKEHVQKCLSQFTAFSAARTEHLAAEIAHIALRIEQRLIVDSVENQVKARRLEGLMAPFMLESEFGQHKLRETVEMLSADSSLQSLEYRYMSAQLRSLINSVTPILGCENLSLQAPYQGWNFDAISFTFIEPSLATTASHALFHILGIIAAIHSRDHASLLHLLMMAVVDLPACFISTGMHPEVVIWGRFEIDVLRYMMKRGCNTGTLPRIAIALGEISVAHHRQCEFDAAIGISQQSLTLWVGGSHLLPEADTRIGYLDSMVIHAKNFLGKDDKTSMLSVAKDAASVTRPMAKALAESIVSRGTPLTAGERRDICHFCEAFFFLAQVLFSLDRPLDSYEAFLEASRTACSLPIFSYDPNWGQYVNSFLKAICTVAEDGRLSLSMLADCVDLFRNLAGIYPKQFSSGFLRVLHAWAYFTQQPHSHSTEQIRLFLAPSYRATPPAIDIAASIPIDSGVLADAMRLFFAEAPEDCNEALIQNILVARFPQAIEALRVVIQSPVFDKFVLASVLPITCAVLPHLSPAEYVALLRVLAEAVECKSCHTVLDTLTLEEWKMHLAPELQLICEHAKKTGVVDEGISLCQEIVTYLESQFDARLQAVMWLQVFLGLWLVLLCDAARFPDVVDLVKRKGSRFPASGDLASNESWYLSLWAIKAHILQRVGRHKEALQLLRTGVADRIRKFWAEGPAFDIQLYLLLPQLAWAWKQVGEPVKALEYAKKAVAACHDVDTQDTKKEELLYVQIHSLTTHSNCLVAVGRIDEGLESARKAVSLYTTYSPRGHTWNNIIFPIRGQELGGNAFFALSLRLLAVDDKEESLSNGRRATGLYRELVALAPRHLPNLARSLRHLASILWLLRHEDEAMAASEEAVDILRKVVDLEMYFLPIFADALGELAGYLTKRGDSSSAATATAEAAAARLRFTSLPPEPEWLFERVEAQDGEDADWWEWEPEKYHDALEGSAGEDSAEAEESRDDAGDAEFEDALSTIGIAEEEEEQTVAVEIPEGNIPPIFVATGHGASQSNFEEADDMDHPGIASAGEPARGAETQTFTKILSQPVEIKLSMRSTLMDFLWWIMLLIPAILFALMYTRVV
ncbi:Tetratricopeptide repeat family [Favolaschia claudopus]|uniref:Tetratricopeptide repeat family n=1 Tax=Favolaschia claudopus TaxID=2862362 RepID=A0AAW0AA76_9AGAR